MGNGDEKYLMCVARGEVVVPTSVQSPRARWIDDSVLRTSASTLLRPIVLRATRAIIRGTEAGRELRGRKGHNVIKVTTWVVLTPDLTLPPWPRRLMLLFGAILPIHKKVRGIRLEEEIWGWATAHNALESESKGHFEQLPVIRKLLLYARGYSKDLPYRHLT